MVHYRACQNGMTILVVGFSIFVDALSYSIVVVFLPDFLKDNDIPSEVEGFSFSAFSFGALISYAPVALLVDQGPASEY